MSLFDDHGSLVFELEDSLGLAHRREMDLVIGDCHGDVPRFRRNI